MTATPFRRQGPFLLPVATPAGYAELLLRRRVDHARANPDRGASVVEWVIISALVVGIAVAVGAILLNRLRDKANSIDFDTPGSGGGSGGGGVP